MRSVLEMKQRLSMQGYSIKIMQTIHSVHLLMDRIFVWDQNQIRFLLLQSIIDRSTDVISDILH